LNSQERRDARYHRRKAKREARRLAILEQCNFSEAISTDNLYQAMKEARKGVYWKASTQRYNMNFLRNILQTHKALQEGKDVRKGFIEFKIVERGKQRHIRSVHFSERVVQKSLCTNVLIPHLVRSLIHDNGASVTGKGIHFAINRLKRHLRQHFKQHGKDGYVLLIDFKGYFEHILHEPLRDIYDKAFGEDKKLVELAMLFVYAFGERGLGLGSEVSQINAITYSSGNDHHIKEVLRCKHYGRYMDDSYFLCETKEQAQRILDVMLERYAALGIQTSPRKTSIVKISRGFSFLKTHFSLEDTGRIVVRPGRVGIVRQRRKLKKFKKFLDSGQMALHSICNSYMSWRGYVQYFKSRKTVHNMDALYKRLLYCTNK